jgi:UDP-N-acetylmuramoylalanine--D-glutamate ligase
VPRMENIGAIGKVRFVNDSKATKADAARQAMAATPRFRWIAGGVSKAGGIEPLGDLFGRVAKAYLIGEASEDFARTLDGKAPYAMCGDLEAATAMAFHDALASGEDEVVLLSPACASFDQFADFEQRGEAFRTIVAGLGGTAQRAAG